MKLKNLYIACGALFFGTAALTGCSDDDSYDVEGSVNNLIYVDPAASNTAECTVYHTPVGTYGDVTANVKVRLQYACGDSLTVTAVADTTLVSQYNTENNATAVTVPEAVLKSLQFEKTGISAGANAAVEPLKVTIPALACSVLTQPEYVVPLRLSGTKESNTDNERPVSASQDMGVYYLAIHTTSDMVYLTGSKTSKSSIVRTPVGIFGSVDATYNVGLHFQLDSDVKVSATVDNSLIDTYNTDNSQSYVALPSNVASALEITPATIAAGETSASLKVTMPADLAQSLTEKGYVAPLRLVAEYSNGTKVTLDSEVAYLVVTTEESLIQDKPTALLGTGVTDISAWTCIYAVNYNKDELKLNSWKPSVLKVDNASFVVDFGDVHKVGAFRLRNYVGTSFRFYLSEDNSTWVDLGDVSGKSTYRESYYNQWYVLYGAVRARYVKVEQVLDPSSYYWNYASYSWGASYVGTTWAVTFAD